MFKMFQLFKHNFMSFSDLYLAVYGGFALLSLGLFVKQKSSSGEEHVRLTGS